MSNGERAPSPPVLGDEISHRPQAAHGPREPVHDARDTLAHDAAREPRTRTRSSHSPPSVAAGTFPHENLDAYKVALELAALAKKVAERIPRGHRNLADHLQRAAANTVLLLAEGANRRGAALKRQRFVESRGESGEVAAAADLVLVLGLGAQGDAHELKHLAGRVSAMLIRLVARLV